MQEIKDKEMPTKTIVVRGEIYHALAALKMIPQEPFNSVIQRLLDRNNDLIRMDALTLTVTPTGIGCLMPSKEIPK